MDSSRAAWKVIKVNEKADFDFTRSSISSTVIGDCFNLLIENLYAIGHWNIAANVTPQMTGSCNLRLLYWLPILSRLILLMLQTLTQNASRHLSESKSV